MGAGSREAAVAALRREVLGYTETAGVLPLRRAIADYLEHEREAVDAEVAWLDSNTALRRGGGEEEP